MFYEMFIFKGRRLYFVISVKQISETKSTKAVAVVANIVAVGAVVANIVAVGAVAVAVYTLHVLLVCALNFKFNLIQRYCISALTR